MLFLTMVAAACAVPDAEAARQFGLAYTQFDSVAAPYGWRHLNGTGCTDAAVSLLRRYEATHKGDLTPGQRGELLFHIGQALAFARRNDEAIAPVQRALDLGGTDEWTTYLAANLAFLRKDKAGLARARARYAILAPNSNRLKFLDGFIACPDDSYMAAAFCTK